MTDTLTDERTIVPVTEELIEMVNDHYQDLVWQLEELQADLEHAHDMFESNHDDSQSAFEGAEDIWRVALRLVGRTDPFSNEIYETAQAVRDLDE